MSDDKKLTFEEFLRMPREEQNIRYKDLSDHDKFRARMNEGGYSLVGSRSIPTDEEFCAHFGMTLKELEDYKKLHNLK